MARALIVGCGCRGRELGSELRGRGWEARGTSRSDEGMAAIAGAGLEPALADPAHPGSVLDLVGDVTVMVWLLGSVRGSRDQVQALHGSRLERLLAKLVDTPVRGVAYEAVGAVEDGVLAAGREIVERAARTWRIPVTALDGEREAPGWANSAAAAIAALPSEVR